jgi:hypothetical protein
MDRLLNVTTILSLVLMAVVLLSVRRAHIRVEFSVSWLVAATVMLILSRSQLLLQRVGSLLGIGDAPMALVMIVFCVFLAVFYRFSLIISDLKDTNIAITQRLAIVEYELKSLDGRR